MVDRTRTWRWSAVALALGTLVCTAGLGQLAVTCRACSERPGLCGSDLEQAADPGDFEQYVLHLYEPSAGLVLETYSIPDPTDPAAPAFVNTTYSAETTELCYFVVTEGPAGVFGPSSDTLCSIHLTADPSLTPGLVDLNFNSPRIGTSGVPYPEPLAVEFLDADGNWLQINSIATTAA